MIDFNQALQSLTDKLTGWVQAAIVSLPNLIIAVLVFLLFYFGARAAKNLIQRALDSVSHNRQVNGLIATTQVLHLFVRCKKSQRRALSMEPSAQAFKLIPKG